MDHGQAGSFLSFAWGRRWGELKELVENHQGEIEKREIKEKHTICVILEAILTNVMLQEVNRPQIQSRSRGRLWFAFPLRTLLFGASGQFLPVIQRWNVFISESLGPNAFTEELKRSFFLWGIRICRLKRRQACFEGEVLESVEIGGGLALKESEDTQFCSFEP